MKLSIVTVCYNAEKTIADTIDSITKQAFDDFECIFIDGNSTDRTCEIIRNFSNRFSQKGVQWRLLSEPDKGIYDAMNKGAKMAKGDWITFMNADDKYYDKYALQSVFKYDLNGADVVYGNTYFNKTQNPGIEKAKAANTITHHLPFCPQAAFVRTDVQKQLMFDCAFSISADYDFFLRCYLKKLRFLQLNETIAVFNWGGASNNNLADTYRQDTLVKIKNRVVSKYSPLVYLKWGYFLVKNYFRKV